MKTITVRATLTRIDDSRYQAKYLIFNKAFETNNVALKSFLMHPESGVGTNERFYLRVTNFGLGEIISVNRLAVNVQSTDPLFDNSLYRPSVTTQMIKTTTDNKQ